MLTPNHSPPAPSPSLLQLYCGLLVCIAALAFIAQMLLHTTQPTKSAILGQGTQLSEAQILSLINLERVKNNLKPLTQNDSLTQAARNKADDLVQSSEWSHTVNGKTPWSYLETVGYSYSHAGENLARNFVSNEAVVAAWLNSPTHRNNILSPNYSETGLAVYLEPGNQNKTTQIIIVQVFAHPLDPTYQVSPSYQLTAEITQDLDSAKPFLSGLAYTLLTLALIGIVLVLIYSYHTAHKHFVPNKNMWHLEHHL